MIARCKNDDCPLKRKCYRYQTDEGRIWGDYQYDDGCDYYIDVRRMESS